MSPAATVGASPLDRLDTSLSEVATLPRRRGEQSPGECFPYIPVLVIMPPMPEFQRGVALAYCDSPGPLDRGQKTFYVISPIPNDWTEDPVKSFLREYNTRSIYRFTRRSAMGYRYPTPSLVLTPATITITSQ